MTNAIIGIVALFNAVCTVEGNRQGWHPDGVSYGPAGITQGCLDELRKEPRWKHNWTLADMDNPACALEVFTTYTAMICRRHKDEVTPRNRLHYWHPFDRDYAERVMNLAEGSGK